MISSESAFGVGDIARLVEASRDAGLPTAFAVIGFAVRHRGEPMLTWEYAQPRMVWGLIYLFAGGSALGQVLSATGTAQFVAGEMLTLAGSNDFVAVVVFEAWRQLGFAGGA